MIVAFCCSDCFACEFLYLSDVSSYYSVLHINFMSFAILFIFDFSLNLCFAKKFELFCFNFQIYGVIGDLFGILLQ